MQIHMYPPACVGLVAFALHVVRYQAVCALALQALLNTRTCVYVCVCARARGTQIQIEEPLPGGPVGHMAMWQQLAHQVNGGGGGGLHNPYPHWHSLAEKARCQSHAPYKQWRDLASKAQEAFTHSQQAYMMHHQQATGFHNMVAAAAGGVCVSGGMLGGSLYPQWELLTEKMTSRVDVKREEREREERAGQEETERTIWHEGVVTNENQLRVPIDCQLLEVRRGLSVEGWGVCVRIHMCLRLLPFCFLGYVSAAELLSQTNGFRRRCFCLCSRLAKTPLRVGRGWNGECGGRTLAM